MATAAKRTVTRRPRQTEGRPPKFGFRQVLTEFLTNKAMVEVATLRNDGDSKKGITGIKASLLEYVKANGEKDPDSGSFFIELDEPIDIDVNGNRYKRVKAERRQGQKALDVEKAKEYLEKRGLLDEVEEFQYVLRLPADLAEMFGEWLKETGLIERVVSTDAVFVEDNLLALHQKKTGKKIEVDGKEVDERVISESDLDALYVTPDPQWAFVTLTR
jgi:hypothetical protein